MTFHQLQDLVDRLLILFQVCFDLRDQEEFELLPVSFISMVAESCIRTEVSVNCCDLEHDVQPSVSFENKALSNDEQYSSADVSQQYVQVQDSVHQLSETADNKATSTDEQAHLTEVSVNCCDREHDVQPPFTFENKALSNDEQCLSADVPQQYVQVQDPVHQLSKTAINRDTSTDEQAHLIYQDKMEVLTTVTQNRDKHKNVPLSELSHDIPSQDQFALSAPNHQNSQFTVKQTEKLNKTQKRRSYCKKWHKEMVQRQGVYDKKQAVREVYDYKTSSEYRKRHNQAMMNNYWNKMTFREKHKQAMKNNYKNNEKYRGNKKSKITLNYKNDEQYRDRQKIYIIQNYRNQKQFRERQKNYIIQNYRNNVKYKEQLKQNLVDRYLKDPTFRQRQKDHYTNRCKNDPNFYKKRKDIFKQYYHCDAHFRARQKEYHLFKSKNKTSALKVLHKLHCAQEIQYKYKNMYLKRRQRETLQDSQHDIVQDPGMLRALSIFRDVIKQGPTYVCTCCARALLLQSSA